MDSENMNNGLATGLDGVQATAGSGLNSSLDLDDAALMSAARLFAKKNHATVMRIERKLAWTSDRAGQAIKILVERGVFAPADEDGIRFNVVSENLRKFLGEDEPQEHVEIEASERVEVSAREMSSSRDEVHPVQKTRFAAPLEGIREPLHQERIGRKSHKDELKALLSGLESADLPGMISGDERLAKISQTGREIQNMVDATNSGIRRMELAGKRVSRENFVRFFRYDPSDEGPGGIKLIVKGRDGKSRLLWRVIWDDAFSQDWLDRQTESAAGACQRHLRNLGGYALLKGK